MTMGFPTNQKKYRHPSKHLYLFVREKFIGEVEVSKIKIVTKII